MNTKKEIRENFRHDVYLRDNFKCRKCDVKDVNMDAHHITDRNEMPNGGFTFWNGISLCPECHKKAEVWHNSNKTRFEEGYHPNDLYFLIGSSYEKAYEESINL